MKMVEELINGFKEYLPKTKETVINKDYIKHLTGLKDETKALKEKQLRLQAQTKVVTAQLNEKLKNLGDEVKKGKSVVKNNFETTSWTAFGIDDKR